jgi:hypothetical protein
MNFAHRFPHPARAVAACCLLMLSACASNEVLDRQLAVSREAVDQARIAGAQQGAPAEFDGAVDRMNQANAMAKDKKDKDAMAYAQEAQVDANLARAKNDSAQARFAATEIAKSNQILRDERARMIQNQQR